jgi:hypothetical protein
MNTLPTIGSPAIGTAGVFGAAKSATSAAARSRAWLRVGVADLLMVLVIIGVLQRSQGGLLDDPGLGWHIRNIDAIAAEGWWLSADSFSGPRGGQQWLTNQWLGDLVLYFSWHWGGLEGIATLVAIVLALTYRQLYLMMIDDGVPWPLAALWAFVAALGSSLAWVARPKIFTLLFVMIMAYTVDRFHRGKCTRRQTLWLLPIFCLWANTHGGFVAGLIILATAVCVEACLSVGIPYRTDIAAARQRLKHVGLLLVAAAAVTLVNPYGWKLYPWVFQLLGNEFFMNLHTEWLSPNFHDAGALRYELIMLAFPLLLAFSRRKSISLVALALSIVWLHFALGGMRYVALWVVIVVPLLARLSADVLLTYSGRKSSSGGGPQPALVRGGFAAVLAVVLVTIGWARYVDGYSRSAQQNIPTEALTYVLEHHDGRAVFHDYNWGGWLTWHGWPAVRNWIDDRNEVQGQAHIEQYFDIIGAKPGWDEIFAQRRVQWVCIAVGRPLDRTLSGHADWTERYRDAVAVVYERAPSPQPAIDETAVATGTNVSTGNRP